jgi:hypothetical protein
MRSSIQSATASSRAPLRSNSSSDGVVVAVPPYSYGGITMEASAHRSNPVALT